MIKPVIVFFGLAFLSGCTSITNEQMMQIHQGMSSDEIISMFGQPNNVSVAVCGESPNNWNCTTWEYYLFPEGDASFTFGGDNGDLKLNNFDIDKGNIWD